MGRVSVLTKEINATWPFYIPSLGKVFIHIFTRHNFTLTFACHNFFAGPINMSITQSFVKRNGYDTKQGKDDKDKRINL